MLWLKSLLFTLALPGTVAVLVPWLIVTRLPRWDAGAFGQVGWLALACGAAGYIWCAIDFVRSGRGTPAPWDPPRRLVVHGLYRWSRNPMYVSLVLVVGGEAAVGGSPILGAYAAVVWAIFHARVVLYEEPTLERLFGDAYRAYRTAVPRWLLV